MAPARRRGRRLLTAAAAVAIAYVPILFLGSFLRSVAGASAIAVLMLSGLFVAIPVLGVWGIVLLVRGDPPPLAAADLRRHAASYRVRTTRPLGTVLLAVGGILLVPGLVLGFLALGARHHADGFSGCARANPFCAAGGLYFAWLTALLAVVAIVAVGLLVCGGLLVARPPQVGPALEAVRDARKR